MRRFWLTLSAVGLLSLVGVTPAAAHPFGDPQTVAIGAEGSVVHVRWKVGGLDDLTLLGVALGVLPRDRVMLDGAVIYQPSDGTAIAPSPELGEYLLRRISVASRGKDCPGSVRPVTELAKAGVSIDYTCPEAVGSVDVTVKTLTDLNPAYKTLATGPNGARAVYGEGAEQHEWTLGAEQHLGRSAAVQVGAVAGGLVLVVAGVLGVLRLRRRGV